VNEDRVGLLGATSLVGECLLSLLTEGGRQVFAFSRKKIERQMDYVTWQQLGLPARNSSAGEITGWICVAPVWVLPDYFPMLEKYGVRRVVVLSSTSRFTKEDSSDAAEKETAVRLADGEEALRKWAEGREVEWVVLRPTLIYGFGLDKNIAEIVRFIRRFRFFPLFGPAQGLRQPVHAADVAAACVAALESPVAANHAYNLSGGEVLPYRVMIVRVFTALHCHPLLVSIPLGAFRVAVSWLRLYPRYRHWSTAMAERMNRDLVFDHAEAARDLGFSPRPFRLGPEDLSA
jgi:nucleoside-diphosphate-sugar epimerase